MRSRRLLLLLVLGFLAINFPVLAQSAKKVYRLGILSPGSGVIERMSRTTVPELAKLGFSEGQNLVFVTRSGAREQLPELAREIAAAGPDAVIAVSGSAIRAMRQAAPTVPIIGAFIGEDPIAAGFASSLSHPGGTITGIVMLAPELDAKRLFLLREAAPSGRRVAALAVNATRDTPNLVAKGSGGASRGRTSAVLCGEKGRIPLRFRGDARRRRGIA